MLGLAPTPSTGTPSAVLNGPRASAPDTAQRDRLHSLLQGPATPPVSEIEVATDAQVLRWLPLVVPLIAVTLAASTMLVLAADL